MALGLGALIFTLVLGGPDNFDDQLDKDVANVERAIRFALDEAAVRNSIVRLKFSMDGIPQPGEEEKEGSREEGQGFVVEYFTQKGQALPRSLFEKPDDFSKEEAAKKKKSDNAKFKKVAEFEDGHNKLEEVVKLVGVGNPEDKEFVSDGDYSMFFYPTGEKDPAFIVLSTEEKLITLEVDAFTNEFRRTDTIFDEGVADSEDFDEVRLEMASEKFKAWVEK